MKTVCIVGMAPTTAHLFIHEPLGIEIWGLNQGHALFTSEAMARFTGWFQVHPYEEMAARQNPELGHLDFLRQAQVPVYMEEVHPDIPASTRYPYQEVVTMLGGTYLTSAPAFMLALAIYQGFELIKIYGIDMASETEYQDQRPCFEFLLGFAIGHGIKVWLPPDCPLLKGPLYAKTVFVTTSTIERRLNGYISQRDTLLAEYNVMVGKVLAAREMLQLALKGEGKEGPGRIGLWQDPAGGVHLAEADHLWSANGVAVRGTEAVYSEGAIASAGEPVLGNSPPIAAMNEVNLPQTEPARRSA
jgi:hypothetical protein